MYAILHVNMIKFGLRGLLAIESNISLIDLFPAFRMSYEVCGTVHSVQFVRCYRTSNANFLSKFELSVHSEAKLSSEDEHF